MRKFIIGFTLFILLTSGAYLISVMSKAANREEQAQKLLNREKIIGRIGEGYFNFELADTNIERVSGLSGRNSLAATDAMLFVFDTTGKHCIWMKDMRFSIDILWFDEDKKLVYEKRNVSPSTYPSENFCPNKPAKYVVEVTAGVAAKNHIRLGDKLEAEL